MAEFESPTALVHAANKAREAGYRRMDAYSPIPIEELHEALGLPQTKLPLIVLGGGADRRAWRATACSTGRRPSPTRSTSAAARSTAGRSFIVPTFETTILFAALTAVLGMLVAQRAADAVPPGVQRDAVRDGEPRPVLPVHRGGRPEVRPRPRRGGSSRASAPREVNDVERLRPEPLAARAGRPSARRRCCCVAGCRQDMHDQPKYKPLREERLLRRPARRRGRWSRAPSPAAT